MRTLGVLATLCAGAVGCSPGSVIFEIEAPAQGDPLADGRSDSVSIADELSGRPLGSRVSVRAREPGMPAEAGLGSIAVGNYDLRLAVTGGGQLLGLARTRGVTILPSLGQRVVMHVRKPLAFFGSDRALPSLSPVLPAAGPLMGLDTTLPALERDLTVQLGDRAQLTATTADGRFVFIAAGARLYALDTRSLLDAGPARATMGSPILALAMAPGDRALAVVVADGVATVTDPIALASGGNRGPLAVTPAPGGARAAAFDRQGNLAVLTGLSWEQIDCSRRPAPQSMLYTGKVGGGFGPARRTLDGATDIAFTHDDHLLIASPCADGVYDLDGNQILRGAGITDVVVTNDGEVLGIGGEIARVKAPFDPDDPRQRNVELPFGQLVRSSRNEPVLFPIPSYRIGLELADIGGGVIQVRLQPSRIDAYDAAVSPDGGRVVFAQRQRYQARDLNYFELVDARKVPYYYCILNTTEDVYGVTQIEVASGRVEYSSNKGIANGSCVARCYLCSQFERPPCPLNAETMCRFSDGFVPSGVSVLMGAP